MKMGTILSLWRYDAVAAQAIRPDNQRQTAILRYGWGLRGFVGGPVSFECGHFGQSWERRDGTIGQELI